jgi:hypothetical protein
MEEGRNGSRDAKARGKREDMEQIPMTELEMEIVRLMAGCRGEGAALRRRNLVEMLEGLACDRIVRKTIKHLVTEHGVLIASSPEGYFTPVTPQEIWRACEYYHSYAMSALETESKLRKLIGGMVGQLRMDLGDGAEKA